MATFNWLRHIVNEHGAKRQPERRAAPGRQRVRLLVEHLEDRLAPAIITVINTADSGAGSLRQAMLDANSAAFPGLDTINFNIPGSGVQTISPTSALPTITDPVTIDGYSQTGASPNTLAVGSDAVLLIELDGSLLSGGNGLQITAGGSTVQGLVINRFGGNGIQIAGAAATGNRVQGNFIGIDVTGTAALPNDGDGVAILGAPNNTIGGTMSAARNVISGNSTLFAVLQGGVYIEGFGATGNVVQGNYIGTDVSGTLALGNGRNGVVINNAPNNTIGGIDAGAGNVISANGAGGDVLLEGSATTGILVQGNRIGTNAAGTAALAGSANAGVSIVDGANNTIGGTAAGAGNLISTGDRTGVVIFNSTGSTSASNNLVQGNLIGTDVAGTLILGNDQGVTIFGASDNTIGGTAAGAGNVISGNGTGIFISSPGGFVASAGNVVQGNFIGTDITGTAALSNQFSGVSISGVSAVRDNLIGGVDAGAGNVIAYNKIAGVFVGAFQGAGPGNAIRGNSIFANGGLGIDLGAQGVTPNDPDDPDTGPNNLQNFPVLTSAQVVGSILTVTGTLNSTANTTFRVEFFANQVADPSNFGEGEAFVGFMDVTTIGNDASFTAVFQFDMSPGSFITATATDPDGNTSEFSANQIVVSSDQTTVDLADVAIDMTAVAGKRRILYTITVRNLGPSDAENVTLADLLPPQTLFIAQAQTSGPSFVLSNTGNQITNTIGLLPTGAVATFNVLVRAPRGCCVVNAANVVTGTHDPQPGNNTIGLTTLVGNKNQRWLAQVYRDVIKREIGDPALKDGEAFLNRPGNPRTLRLQYMQQLLKSLLYFGRISHDTYMNLLNEPTHNDDCVKALDFLHRGGTREQLHAQVYGDPEYFVKRGGGTRAGWAAALFQDIFGRPIHAAGAALIERLLAKGLSREAVAQQLQNRVAARAHLVHGWFQRFLERDPNQAELTRFVNDLGRGVSDEQIIAIIVSSPEYFQKTCGASQPDQHHDGLHHDGSL